MNIEIPTVWIDEKILEKIFGYITVAEGEVGGLGEVSRYSAGLFITEAHLFRQKTSEVETTLDTLALASFMSEMLRAGKDIGKLRLWWHSHGEFEVGWSKDKDEKTIASLSKKNYLISIVGNKAGYYLARYDAPGVTSPIHLSVYKTASHEEFSIEAIAREVSEKVTFQKEEQKRWLKWPISKGR